jgi:hypothetical protein
MEIAATHIVEAERPSGARAATARRVLVDRASLQWIVPICIVALVLFGRGATDEGAVSMQGDMPRYMMNGVYFLDLFADAPLTDLVGYTQRYYFRYPALSLGHHPILVSLAEVPAFAVLGISVFSARVTILAFGIILIVYWFLLVQRLIDRQTAVLSSLILVTTPRVVQLAQMVLSEIPTLALIVVAFYYLHRFCGTRATRDLAFFAGAAVLSLYAKQVAVFMVPIYIAYLVVQLGPRVLIRRDVLVVGVIAALCVLPLVPMTLMLSRFNVTVVTQWVPQEKGRFNLHNVLLYVQGLSRQVTVPVLALSTLSAVLALARRDRRVLLCGMWIVLFYVQITLVGVGNVRIATYWIPAFSLLAAAVIHGGRSAIWRRLSTATVLGVIAYQAVVAAGIRPQHAEGYEEAARFVVENAQGDSVLFSAAIDTGYFVFFARKHDPDRNLVVLRADKVLTTSRMGELAFESQVKQADEILPILRRFGVGHIVIEETTYPEGPLTWLRELLETDQFVLRRRIPLKTSDRRLQNTSLAIYEYRERTAADRDAVIQMNIPLVDRSIAMRVGDLLEKPSSK